MHIEDVQVGQYIIITHDRQPSMDWEEGGLEPIYSGCPRKVFGVSAPFILTEYKGSPVTFDVRRFSFVVANDDYATAWWDLENSYDKKRKQKRLVDKSNSDVCIHCGGSMICLHKIETALGEESEILQCDQCGNEITRIASS